MLVVKVDDINDIKVKAPENIPVRYGSVSYRVGYNQAVSDFKEELSKMVVYEIDDNI